MKAIHILLVEDNEGDIVLTRETLEELDFNIKLTVFRDGRAAIDFLKDQQQRQAINTVDLMLLDINLPKINGLEVLNYVNSIPAWNLLPVIMLTTSCFERDRELFGGNNASAYLVKPLEAESIKNILNAIILKEYPISRKRENLLM